MLSWSYILLWSLRDEVFWIVLQVWKFFLRLWILDFSLYFFFNIFTWPQLHIVHYVPKVKNWKSNKEVLDLKQNVLPTAVEQCLDVFKEQGRQSCKDLTDQRGVLPQLRKDLHMSSAFIFLYFLTKETGTDCVCVTGC